MSKRAQNNREVLKKRDEDLSFIEFQAKFITEDDCRQYLFQLRWTNGFHCTDCGNTSFYYIN